MTFKEWFMESYGYDDSQAMGAEISAWNAALEEAAKAIENIGTEWGTSESELTTAIRSLKETP